MLEIKSPHLLDHLHLPIESRCPALDQRHVCRQAHPVHMSPRIQIVQRIENDCEGLEPVDIELRIFDIGVMRLDLDIRVEFAGGFFRDLSALNVSVALLVPIVAHS